MKKILSLFAAVLFAGTMCAADLLSIDFTQGQGDWTINDVNKDTLDYVWKQDATYGMKASAYVNKANHATESWLVSPKMDLTGVESATLAFSHARKFGDLSQLSVVARVYGSEADPVVLEVSAWPDGSNWNYIDATADLSAFAGKADVQVIFIYTSTTAAAATWEIKTVAVGAGGEVTPPEVKVDTITVAEAVAIAQELAEPESGKSTYSNKEVVVKGYAVSVYDKNSDGSWSFYMADETGVKGEFMASSVTADADVVQGDYMYVSGKICKYKAKSSGNIILQIYKGTATHGEAPEGIENVVLTEKAQKVVVDGVVYIIRDNKMFNLQGAQVR